MDTILLWVLAASFGGTGVHFCIEASGQNRDFSAKEAAIRSIWGATNVGLAGLIVGCLIWGGNAV